MDGVSIRVVGIRLGPQFSKLHDKRVNANGENLINALLRILCEDESKLD
jgi:hypothetical protein